MKTLYTARAHNEGGRDGRATAADGNPDLVIKPPAELGGPSDMPEATNPEELFALGFGACFLSALSLVARQQKSSATEFPIDSAAGGGRGGAGGGRGWASPGTVGASALSGTARRATPGGSSRTGGSGRRRPGRPPRAPACAGSLEWPASARRSAPRPSPRRPAR